MVYIQGKINYMTKENKLKDIAQAMEIKEVDDKREHIYIIADTCPTELKEVLMNLIYDENIGGIHDLSYEICYNAINILNDRPEFADCDDTSYLIQEITESGSIYTVERLSYLNNMNECEIYDIIKEYDVKDISTACAVWFDDMVRKAVETIISDYINKEI